VSWVRRGVELVWVMGFLRRPSEQVGQVEQGTMVLRMIFQGTDGLSRGDETGGVLSGDDMLSFVPLHQTALERSDALKDWLTELLPDSKTNFLSPSEWLGQHRPSEVHVWCPAPAAAHYAVDAMAKSIHKRPNSMQ